MKPISVIALFLLVSKPNNHLFAKDSDPLESLVKNHVPAVCLQMDYQMRLDESSYVTSKCETPVKLAVCGTRLTNLEAAASQVVAENGVSEQLARYMAEKLDVPFEEVIHYSEAMLAPFVEAAFIADFHSCLNAKKEKLENDTAEELEKPADFETPEEYTDYLSAAIAKQVFWTIASYAAKGGIYKIAVSRGVDIKFSRLVGYAICQSASAFVASLKPATVASFGEASCQEASKWKSFSGAMDRLRTRECLYTVADTCSALGGFVNLNDWGIETSSQAAQVFLDVSGFGLTTLCYSQGRTVAVACGTINTAIKNLIQFARTGNNNISECLTGPIARCLGHRIGARGWLDNSAVAQPYHNKFGHLRRKCCECDKVYYKKTFFGERELSRVLSRGVVQEQSGPSCSHRNPKTFHQPVGGIFEVEHADGYRYLDCKKITVRGSTCTL